MPFDHHLSSLDTSAFDFPVELRPVHVLNEGQTGESAIETIQAASHKAVFRPDTEEVLAVVSNRYKLTPHVEIFDAFNDVLDAAGLATGRLEVKDHIMDDGALAMRSINFLDHEIDVGNSQNSDPVAFRVDIYNSVNGRWAFHQIAGAIRFACLNGMVSGDMAFWSRIRHTRRIRPESEASRLTNALNAMEKSADEYRKMRQTGVREDAVQNLFKNTLAAAPTRSDPKAVNKTQLDGLLKQYDNERHKLGENAWAVFNTATHWSSHPDVKRADPAIVSHDRQAKVAAMLNSPEWDRIVMPF